MYYLAKAVQAAGLAIIGMDFLGSFPGLMSYRVFFLGLSVFLVGWAIERFTLKG